MMKTPTMAPVYAVLYAKMAEAAQSCGYALAVHGSMQRDLDVVAIPWTEEAKSAEEVVRAMAEVAARRVGSAPVIGYQASSTSRPHGRVGFSFPFVSTDGVTPDGYVDVSVMPRAAPAAPPPAAPAPSKPEATACRKCQHELGSHKPPGGEKDWSCEECECDAFYWPDAQSSRSPGGSGRGGEGRDGR